MLEKRKTTSARVKKGRLKEELSSKGSVREEQKQTRTERREG